MNWLNANAFVKLKASRIVLRATFKYLCFIWMCTCVYVYNYGYAYIYIYCDSDFKTTFLGKNVQMKWKHFIVVIVVASRFYSVHSVYVFSICSIWYEKFVQMLLLLLFFPFLLRLHENKVICSFDSTVSIIVCCRCRSDWILILFFCRPLTTPNKWIFPFNRYSSKMLQYQYINTTNWM